MDWLSPDQGERCGGAATTAVAAARSGGPPDPFSQIVFDETLATGAVITGKRTGDFAGYWGGDHHDGVEIFVPTHERTGRQPLRARALRPRGHRRVRSAGQGRRPAAATS